jgi:hypothetical protein
MRMKKLLLLVGGVLNLFFFAFHLFLGYQIHESTSLPANSRALMEMLNVAGTLMILLFAWASLFCRVDLLHTSLGKVFLWFVMILYASRALEEIILLPHSSLFIFASCLLISVLYAVVFFDSSPSMTAKIPWKEWES